MIPSDDFRPVSLDEAAALAGLTPDTLLELASDTQSFEPEDRITILPGDLFDVREMTALKAILEGQDA